MRSVSGAVAIATGAQASSLAIIRRRDNGATGTVALQSYPVASTTPRGLPARGPQPAPGTDSIISLWDNSPHARALAIRIVPEWLQRCGETLGCRTDC